jgi:hypothetical protein
MRVRAQCEWLLDAGADVVGIDLSPGVPWFIVYHLRRAVS